MSPAMDLVLWEMTWHVVNLMTIYGECEFCGWCTTHQSTPATTADLLNASRHECGGHNAALQHVVYKRYGLGEPFTKMSRPE